MARQIIEVFEYSCDVDGCSTPTIIRPKGSEAVPPFAETSPGVHQCQTCRDWLHLGGMRPAASGVDKADLNALHKQARDSAAAMGMDTSDYDAEHPTEHPKR